MKSKKQEELQGTQWLGVMLDLLRFGALGAVMTLVALAIAASLISIGTIGISRQSGAVAAACILGSLVGGVLAVRSRKSAALPVGLGVGVVLFLMLLSAGVILFDSMPTLNTVGAVAGSCVCGGGLAGVVAGKPKKKHRK